ncbi:HMG box [Opisthorchis viverrini]|uniref:Tyrosine-protein phosphatase dsp1 n=3 Tax=Opisthorchiidae TaxID=6196 RepID=A0A419PQR1_CLOSI|nr:hypothetical protein T265_10726 [Opisthorchis viverrini]KAG5446049.1 Tyrosine-protein phosphatase dsp1 [Clonorchis sinensis]KER20809.1 hypothetical protein T265_10726 [Opisthorchis viverrini]OON19823.1 HMG box [Opisthorchis viverrini]
MAKDKSKPKGALTPYALFLQSMHADQKKKHPSVTLDFKTFSKECSEQWKNLTAKEKKKFEDLAAKDKERYRKEMQSYEPPADEGKSRKRKKDPNAPKKALSAFFLFCNDERPKVKADHPDWKVSEIAKELGKRWETCKNKSKYESQAQVEKQRYEKAMAKYNAGKKAKLDSD